MTLTYTFTPGHFVSKSPEQLSMQMWRQQESFSHVSAKVPSSHGQNMCSHANSLFVHQCHPCPLNSTDMISLMGDHIVDVCVRGLSLRTLTTPSAPPESE